MILPRDFAPFCAERLHMGVARDIGVDFGPFDAVGAGQSQRKDFTAADHRDFRRLARHRQRGIQIMRDFGPLNPEAPAFPLATSAVAPLRAAAEARGQNDYSPLWSGQNASDCQALPAADIAHKLLQGWT